MAAGLLEWLRSVRVVRPGAPVVGGQVLAAQVEGETLGRRVAGQPTPHVLGVEFAEHALQRAEIGVAGGVRGGRVTGFAGKPAFVAELSGACAINSFIKTLSALSCSSSLSTLTPRTNAT